MKFILEYLGGTPAFGGRARNLATLSVVALWLAAIVFLSLRHDLWRDEVRALSVATTSAPIWQMPEVIANQGHPLLWYLLLRVAFSIAHTTAVLKVVSVLVAVFSVLVFLRYAPLPMWQKLIFLAGVLPAYDYSVRCRNYGISMLLLFVFAALQSSRVRRPLAVGVVLALLANTNIHACIVAALLVAWWFVEGVTRDRSALGRRGAFELALGLVIALAGIWLCVATVVPDGDAIGTVTARVTPGSLFQALSLNLLHPGLEFEKALPLLRPALRDGAILLFVVGLLTRPALALLLYFGAVSLGTFSVAVYPISLRHQGLFVIFLLVLYWIAAARERDSTRSVAVPWLARVHRQVATIGIALFLAAQVVATAHAARRDLKLGWSPSGAYGRLIRSHAEYRDAILMGEPDYFMDALPYYVPNRIYIPRERRFGTSVSFTRANQDSLSLGELLQDARMMATEERRPVLIAIGHRGVAAYPEGAVGFSYRKVFTWTPAERAEFAAGSTHVASFDTSASGERYDVYLVR